MLKVIRKELYQPDVGGKILDLGSGWGGVTYALARQYPHQEIVGVEISPLPWLFSRFRLLIWPQKNLKFVLGDFFRIDMSDALLVVCYLLPKTMEKLSEKFSIELPRGGIIISNTFRLRDWSISMEEKVQDLNSSSIFVYHAENEEK